MYGLKKKILFLTLLPLIVTLVIISTLSIYNKNNTEKQLLINGVDAYRNLLESGNLNFDSLKDKSKLELFLNEKVDFAEILGTNYSVIYTSENSAAPLITDQEKKIVDEAFQGIETIENVKKNNKSTLQIFTPLIVNGQAIAVLHQGISYKESNTRILQYTIFFLSLIIISIIFCYFFISILLKTIVLKNIYHLQNIVIEMQKNNFDIPITIESNDEIGDFAKTFEIMRSEVNKNRKKLEEYNKELGEQVRQRTLELKTKLEELEKLNKFMVNREVAMVELKKENQGLREKINSLETTNTSTTS